MRKPLRLLALATVVAAAAAFPAVASADTTYYPTSDSFSSANAPSGTHLANNSPQPLCTVNSSLDVNCNGYTLGGVGGTDADVSLTAHYSAIIDCYNHGTNPNNPVESHTTTYTPKSKDTATPGRNGQLRVPKQSVSFANAPVGCPNPNWTPKVRPGTLTLSSFTYTLTFVGFSNPYITITGP